MAAFLPASHMLPLLPVVVSFMVVSADQRIITAEPGENVTLPCRPAENKPVLVAGWNRIDLGSDQYVLLYRSKQFDSEGQSQSFKNRVSLVDMENGDVSLVLKNVTTDDTGRYECRVAQRGNDLDIQDTDPISIIDLRVQGKKDELKEDQNQNQKMESESEDGGKEDGRQEDGGEKNGRNKTGLIVGLSVFGIVVVVVVVVVLVLRRRQRPSSTEPNPPPATEAELEQITTEL